MVLKFGVQICALRNICDFDPLASASNEPKLVEVNSLQNNADFLIHRVVLHFSYVPGF
jgi:hypothetical protein